MKAIRVTLVVLLLVFSGCISTYNFNLAFERYAIVQDSINIGSAVRCGNGRLITATHLITDSTWVTVTHGSFEGTSVKLDRDITRLYGDWQIDTVEIDDVSLGEPVFWIQPRFESGAGAFLTFARVAMVTDSSFFVDRPVMFGASGSGVWSFRGGLVGIVQSIVSIHSFPMYARVTRLWAYRRSL